MNLFLLLMTVPTSSTATIAMPAPPLLEPVARTERFAIVVGVNHPLPGSDYDTLKYADDDALRFTEFFQSIGVRTTVLTVPDRETAERYPKLVDQAARPTRDGLEATLDRLEEALAEAEGKTRELFFVFSGHGSISSSLAYLHLFDAPFTRTDLFEQILKRMPAERIHVIIDSCHSYFLVNARGQRVAVAEEEESLDRHPGAGFLLSTSDNKEVQEWSGYQAGVFSYQVLGALRGAADVDQDGVVTYDEIHAYVVAANMAVKRADARIQPYVRRPTTHGRAVIDHRAPPGAPRVSIPKEIGGHFYVSDDAGVRVLDAHKPAGESLSLVLPERERFFVHLGESVYQLEGNRLARLATDDEIILASSKGTVADEFRTNLFKTPLTRDFVLGLSAATPQVTHVHRQPGTSWLKDPWTLTLLGTGAASVVAGAFATFAFDAARDEGSSLPVTAETEAARNRAQTWQGVMIGTYATGGALLVTGVLRALLTNVSEDASFAFGGGPDGSAGVTFARDF